MPRQSNIAINKARALVFFEGDDIAYNYKTGQWTAIPAYDGLAYFTIDNKLADIGLVREQATNSYGIQEQIGSFQAATATVTTGDADINQGGTTFIRGVRPLMDGGTWTVRVGSRPDLSTSISWSTSTAITERTGMADFREEGRYQRIEFTNSDGFNTAMGADIDYEPAGEI